MYQTIIMASSRARRSRRRRGRHRHQRRPTPGLGPRPGFDHEKALIIGVIEVLVGLVSAVLAVVAVVARAWGYRYGASFWSGACFVAAGVCGITAARYKTNCSIALFLLLSAVSAALALVVLALAAIGVASDHLLLDAQQLNDGSALVIHSLVIVAALIESVCGSLGAVVGCKAVCGGWYGTEVPLTEPQPDRVTSDHYIANDVDQDMLYPAARPMFMPYPTGPLCMPPEAYLLQQDGVGYGPVVYVMPPPPPVAAYPEAAPDYQLSSTPPPAYSTFDRRPYPTADDPEHSGPTDATDGNVNISNAEQTTNQELGSQQQQQPHIDVNTSQNTQSTQITDLETSRTANRTDQFGGGWRTLPLATPTRVTPRTRPHAWPSRPPGRSVVTRPQGGVTDPPASPKQRITAV